MVDEITGSITALESESTGAVAGFSVVNMAVQLMGAASRFSRAVGVAESAQQGKPLGPYWEEVLHNATASIMCGVASVEAYCNELFYSRDALFSNVSVEFLNELWKNYGMKSIRDKMDLALMLRGKPKMDLSNGPGQNLSTIIGLRNALVHFTPERDAEKKRNFELSKKLENKFTPSSLISDQTIFPRRWATRECTKWVISDLLSIVDSFEQQGNFNKVFPDLASLAP